MCASVFYLDVAYVSHMLQEYVPMISTVLVLCCSKCFHVANCKRFIWMLHMFYTYVSSVYSKCFICFRRMLHSSVSSFRVVFRESWGHGPSAEGWGVASRVPADGACWGPAVGVRGAPGSCGQGHARPHLGSWVSPTWREGSGVAGKEPRAQRQGRGVHARRCEADGARLRWCPDACVCPDIRTLATSIKK